MPGTTATQGLIYPVGTDRACDGAGQLEVLAKGINGRLSVLDALVDTGEAPPMVLVEFVGPVGGTLTEDTNSNSGTIWNTVRVDDAEAYDSGVSAVSIRLPYTAPGQLWEVGMYGEGRWEQSGVTGIVSWSADLVIRDSGGVQVHWSVEERGVDASDGKGSGSIVTLYETAGADLITARWTNFDFAGLGITERRLEYAQLWAIKVSEV